MAQHARVRVRDDPEVRRAQILDEAVRIIGERGYHGFAVQELADRCGITSGGLLYHFKTKEDLLLAVLSELDRRGAALVDAMTTNVAGGGERRSRASVLKFLHAMVEKSATYPEQTRLHAVSQAESVNHEHPGYDHFRQRQAWFMATLARMLIGVVGQPQSTARQISAVLLGLQVQWLREDFGFDLVAEWDVAVAKLLPMPPKRLRVPSPAKSKRGKSDGR